MRVRNWLILGVAALAIIALATMATWRSLMDIATDPVMAPAIAMPLPETGDEVAFGVVSRYNPRKIYRGYQPIMDYLSEVTGRSFVLKLSDSYDQTVQQLVDGEVAFASLGNYTYIHAHAVHGIHGMAVPLNAAGQPFFHSVVVVRDDSPMQTMADIQGQDMAFTSKSSMSYWMALHLLREVGLGCEDLGETMNFRHHETVAEKVLRGEFDVGAVKDIVARQYAAQGLRVLKTSPPIPAVPIAIQQNLDPDLVTSVLDALLDLNPGNPEAAKRMAAWDPEFSHGFAIAHDEDYDTMRQILQPLGGLPTDLGDAP